MPVRARRSGTAAETCSHDSVLRANIQISSDSVLLDQTRHPVVGFPTIQIWLTQAAQVALDIRTG